MLNGIAIPYELADEITVANLKEARRSLLRDIGFSAELANHKPHEMENLRDYHENLFAIEKVLTYFAGDKWND